MRGQVEVQVEARQVAAFLLLDFVDLVLGKHHAALGVVGVRQGQESLRPEAPLADLFGCHRGQLLPRLHAFGQLHPHALLHRLAARHGDALGRPIAQVVPVVQQLHLPFHDFGLRGRHPGDDLVEILWDHDRRVAVGRLLGPKAGPLPRDGASIKTPRTTSAVPPNKRNLRDILLLSRFSSTIGTHPFSENVVQYNHPLGWGLLSRTACNRSASQVP